MQNFKTEVVFKIGTAFNFCPLFLFSWTSPVKNEYKSVKTIILRLIQIWWENVGSSVPVHG